MLTAHLPSGYCLGKVFGWKRWMFGAALIGAVLPDFDLIFFYFVDDRAFHHHEYWVHIPFFWACTACLVLSLLWRSQYRPIALAFFAAIFMHLTLDSLSGGIMWLAPMNDELFSLVTVSATQSHWILSYIFHWTFAFEIAIWGLAAYLYVKDR